jgi:hypothetical protein
LLAKKQKLLVESRSSRDTLEVGSTGLAVACHTATAVFQPEAIVQQQVNFPARALPQKAPSFKIP